ncbi:MAG: tetratricopeptide repeat protein, partial [Planctomycetaceae bacterium]
MRRSLLLVLAVTFCTSTAFGQKQREVMVVHPDVVVKNRSGDKVPVGLGDVLTVTSEKDGFLWVPRLNGWAPKEDTLDVKDAVQLFSATIKEKPSAQAWHHRAKAWYALGRYQKAIDDFDQAIAIARTKRLSDRSDDKDRMVSLQINRANAYRELGKADRAIQGYTSALSL